MKKLLKRIIPADMRRKILTLLNHLWVSFCGSLPIKNRVLFYTVRANGKLLDNSRVLWEALDCDKIIFAHKLTHGNFQKARAYYLILTSRVIVTDDYCRYMRALKLRESQRLFQIWHGCGAFKCFALDADTDITKEQERAVHSQYSAVAVTAEKCVKIFAGAFGVNESVCLPIGLPRTDDLINRPDYLKKGFLEKYPDFKGKTIYLYCPTFREKDGKRVQFNPLIDWKKLSNSLKENERFIVCRHPMMDYELLDIEYDNIVDMTEESTLSIAAASSVLITDYSSTVHDAVLLGVPVLFYCPDYKTYERHFYLDFPQDLPGEMITDSSQLLDSARKTKEKPPLERIEKFRQEQLSACDGHSTERAVKIINGWLR